MLLGDSGGETGTMFNNTWRSLFTTFRCSFGDCTTMAGIPLFEVIRAEHPFWFPLMYCLFIFFVTVGIFNVISAIFVEATMQATAVAESRKRQERLSDHTAWSTHMAFLIRRLMAKSPQYEEFLDYDGNLSQHIDEVMEMEVDGSVLDMVVREEKVRKMLIALEIPEGDHPYLSDILDPQNNGKLKVDDIVNGLRRLRGSPRRSDIVSVDLMVREVQDNIDCLKVTAQSVEDMVESVLARTSG